MREIELFAAGAALILVGCAHAGSDSFDTEGDEDAGAIGLVDSSSPPGKGNDGGAGVDGAGPNNAADAATGVDAATPTGLSPLLLLPDPSGAPCMDLGTGDDCPSGSFCRIDGTSGGRCEECSATPPVQHGQACTASADCDTLYQCYAGHCRGLCPLGAPEGVCPVGASCLDVGNATTGVCSK